MSEDIEIRLRIRRQNFDRLLLGDVPVIAIRLDETVDDGVYRLNAHFDGGVWSARRDELDPVGEPMRQKPHWPSKQALTALRTGRQP